MTTHGRTAMRTLEWAALLLVLFGFWRVYSLFMSNGYLGPPFVFDVGDTFMDWFNTAYYAHNGHAYDVWRTVYLPLSFIITGVFGNPGCYDRSPYDARDCDVVGIGFILVMYAVSILTTGLAFWRADRATFVPRTLAVAFGQPLLFALERGQLIMLTYIAFVALYGRLVRSTPGVVASAAFMANTKVYMVFPLFALAVKRRWRLFEYCALATLALYIVTVFVIGAGTPSEIVSNLTNWFSVRSGSIWDDMLYTTTYKPLLQIDVYQYPVRDYIEQRWVDAGIVFINGYVLFSRLLCWACIALTWLYPKSVSSTRLILFVLMQSFINQNPGGYSLTLIAFLVFLEKGRGPGTIIAIICAYLICVPGDWTLVKLFDQERQSWLSSRTVMSEYVVPWGALIRPGIIAILLWSLAADTLVNVHRTMKRERPLFGLMPGGGRSRSDPAIPPSLLEPA